MNNKSIFSGCSIFGCLISGIFFILILGKLGNDMNMQNAKHKERKTIAPEEKRVAVSSFPAEFDALAQKVERNEPTVKKVDNYTESSEYSQDNPFFTITLKPDITCTQARIIAKKYFPLLVAIRKKYYPEQDPPTCSIDVNNDDDRNLISISDEGIRKGKYCYE